MTEKKIAVGIILALFLLGPIRSSAESVRFGDEFFIAQPKNGIQRFPVTAYVNGVFLVAWQEGHYGWGPNAHTEIRGMLISDGGTTVNKQSFSISDAQDIRELPAVATDGKIFMVVWQDFRNGKDFDIYAARVTANGSVLDRNGIPVAKARGNQCRASISFDGNNFVVAWMDNRDVPQSYQVRMARINGEGSILDHNGIVIASFDEESLKTLLQSDSLKGLPLDSFPKVACTKGECLVGWIQKTEAWKEYPRFIEATTQPEIKLRSRPLSIPRSDALKDERAKDPSISVAVNPYKFMAIYSGIQEKGGEAFFIAGLSFEGADKTVKEITTVEVRQLKGGYKLSESIVPFNDRFIIVWAEGKGRESVQFTLQCLLIDKNNQTQKFEINSWNDSYRGYPFISIGLERGLLVYEEISEKNGMRIAGRMFEK